MTPPTPVVPGEIVCADDPVVILDERPTTTLMVVNAGDRPIQVGSHYHFAEANPTLDFDRVAARWSPPRDPRGHLGARSNRASRRRSRWWRSGGGAHHRRPAR